MPDKDNNFGPSEERDIELALADCKSAHTKLLEILRTFVPKSSHVQIFLKL